MKHTYRVTLILVFVFFATQVIGLSITNQYIDYTATIETGEAQFHALPFNVERPEVEESTSFVYIVSAIIIGTIILLVLIRHRLIRLWKVWFFVAVGLCLTVALAAFIPEIIALVLAVILALLKIYRPNIYVHNMTEVLIYGGLAAIFAPIINVFSAFMLLFLISLYDVYAVWKSKHMVKLAKFQTDSKVFAGLFVPYKRKEPQAVKMKGPVAKKRVVVRTKNAILGGGDMGFPLIFTGVVLKTLITQGVPRVSAFFESLIITFFVTAALFWLLMKSKKDKFYPAMPFLTLGCIIGYVIVYGINYFLI